MKVVVSGLTGSEEEWSALTDAGHEVVFGHADPTTMRTLSDGELIEVCQGADVLISMYCSAQVIEALPELTTIIAPAVGTERVDVDVATANDVLVCHSPSRENVIGVSEASIGLMLALSKRVQRKEERLRDGVWGQRIDRGFLLWGTTVGLIGLGRTGGGVARRLMGWDLNVLAYDPYVGQERFDQLGATRVDLETLLRESDFVSLHVVITPETRKMISEPQLRLMKKNAYLINTARGDALDETALYKALSEDWIEGAALDVFDPEPPSPDNPLFTLDPGRVILTPHNVAGSDASRSGNQRLALENALAVLGGTLPRQYIKNPQVLPSWRGEGRYGDA